MNDFDKIFSEKLHNHKTPPPANGWDQLNAALNKEQNTKKKIIYWRVAAAILLLLIGGISWFSMHHDLRMSPVADETSVESKEPKKGDERLGTDSQQLALENDVTPANQPEKQEMESEKSASSVAESKAKETKIEKKQNKPVPQAPPTLAFVEAEVADTTEVQPLENIQTVETLAVEPLAITESELLALESVKARVSTPVTIIYKPGVHSTDKVEENDEKGMALEFLSELKNTSVSFSDLRNAKAELLAKVFNKKESEVTP